MELDKTEITIRERSTLELLDLSLVVVKHHCMPLVISSLIVGAPVLVLDVWVLAWMVNADSRLIALDAVSSEAAAHWRHAWHLVAHWCLQFPLASLPVTVYLGNQIFFEQLSIRKLLENLRPIAMRSIFVLGIVRLGLISLMIELFVNSSIVFEPSVEIFVLGFLAFGLVMAVRAFYPFAPEILGLEACGFRSSAGGEITYGRRSKWLHQALFGDSFARFLICSMAATCIAAMILSLQIFLLGVTFGRWQWNTLFDHLLLPVTLWGTGIFVAVFRFLAYLDGRIRLEGWEIELQMRAEARRMESESAPPLAAPIQEAVV